MKGGLTRFATLSANGVLHDAANGDAGRDASLPFPLADAGDLSGYDVCGHVGCFEKEYDRRKAEGQPEPPSPAEVPTGEAMPDSVAAPKAPAKAKGGSKVA